MGKKILRVYLAKNDTPYSAAYAKLELPASPWEVWDAMEKVRLQTDDTHNTGSASCCSPARRVCQRI